MFGHTDDNQAVMGSPTVQNPSMLDNIPADDTTAPQDASAATASSRAAPEPSPIQDMLVSTPLSQQMASSAPADQTTTGTPAASDEPQTTTPAGDPTQPQHVLTTDNPFIQTAEEPAGDTPSMSMGSDDSAGESTTEEEQAVEATPAASPLTPLSTSPSGPVDPPVVATPEENEIEETEAVEETEESHSDYLASIASAHEHVDYAPAVDHEKLADMKQEALKHLEPLADHLGDTPEETFKATMMMIQANDNHTLLDKAFKAAKEIKDDKARAQAMLDIINEINYFSQTGSEV